MSFISDVVNFFLFVDNYQQVNIAVNAFMQHGSYCMYLGKINVANELLKQLVH